MASRINRTGLLSTTVMAGMVFAASPAFAQAEQGATQPQAQADGQGENEIVVTGTLIRNPNLVASSPVSVIGTDEIELQQANVAEELLRELPGAIAAQGSQTNNGNAGASFADLRGLGSNRNLTLLDGVRLTPGDLLGRVDLNNIPLALVQRVDVLTGGASTTYGADAISGVINFITRQDFAGLDFTVSNQITEVGDGNIFRADLTLGANFDDGRGNAVVSVGYQEADPVYQGDRDFSRVSLASASGNPGGSGTSTPSRFTNVNPTRGDDANIQAQITPDGLSFNTTPAFTSFNFNPFNIFQTPFERYNIFAAARYEVADGLEVYTRGLFSRQTVSTIIAPSGAFGISVNVNLNNPYLSAAQRNAFCAFDTNSGPGYTPLYTQAECDAAANPNLKPGDAAYRQVTTVVNRRASEFGPRISDYTTTYFDYRAGIRGSITENIDFDVFGSYGESENVNVQQGYYLNSRVRQALLANNTNTCFTTTNNCVPLNLFGADGSITPEMNGFLTESSRVATLASQAQLRGTISGDLGLTLPWATEGVGFALGAEYRQNRASQQSDTLAKSGDLGGAGGAAPDIDGGVRVREVFGELNVPIVASRPFFEELSLEAGARYADYEVLAPSEPTFDAFTWKVGGNWSPVSGLRIRGTYSVAVRAPNISELFAPVNTVLTNQQDDPCASLNGSGVRFRPAPTGALREVCLAQGATTTNVGNIQVPDSGQANLTSGGNLDLTPETAKTWTVGAVFQPRFAPGLSVAVDYYNIVITDAITGLTTGDAIDACFNTGNLSPTNPACQALRRNPANGSLSGDPTTTPGFVIPLTNQGRLATDGIDLSVNYRRNLGFAALALSFNGNYTFSNKFQAAPGLLNRDCVGFYSANCSSGGGGATALGSIVPEFQWSQRTTLTFGNIDVSLLWRHIDGMRYEPSLTPLFRGTLNGEQVDFNRIPAADYFDLSTRFSVNDNLTLTLTVQNLLDRQPPIVGNDAGTTSYNSGNTYPSTYDPLGRRYAVQARLRF